MFLIVGGMDVMCGVWCVVCGVWCVDDRQGLGWGVGDPRIRFIPDSSFRNRLVSFKVQLLKMKYAHRYNSTALVLNVTTGQYLLALGEKFFSHFHLASTMIEMIK